MEFWPLALTAVVGVILGLTAGKLEEVYKRKKKMKIAKETWKKAMMAGILLFTFHHLLVPVAKHGPHVLKRTGQVVYHVVV